MKLELHCHTYYSKGRKIPTEATMSPQEAIKQAKERGLGGIAITDHNNNKAWGEAESEAKKQGIVFIPGIEIGTREGHILGLGLNEKIRRGLSLEDTLDRIRDQGGIAIAAHPFDIRNEGVKEGIAMMDGVEVFNAMNMDRFSNMIAESKADSIGKPKISASDAHSLGMVGTAVTMVEAYDMDSALRAIKAGRTELERNYIPLDIVMEWTRNRFVNSYMDVIRYMDESYFPLRAWIAKAMLRRFIMSEKKGFWNFLGKIGMTSSRVYGGIKVMGY